MVVDDKYKKNASKNDQTFGTKRITNTDAYIILIYFNLQLKIYDCF